MNGVCFPRFLAMVLQSDPAGSLRVRGILLRGFPACWNGTKMGVSMTAIGIFSNCSRLGFECAVPNVENMLPDVRYTHSTFVGFVQNEYLL